MRAESEKKTHSTSVRMSRNQYEQIEKNAAEQNMNISQFMIHAAVHSEQKKKPSVHRTFSRSWQPLCLSAEGLPGYIEDSIAWLSAIVSNRIIRKNSTEKVCFYGSAH